MEDWSGWLRDPLRKRKPSQLDWHQFSGLDEDTQQNWQMRHDITRLKLDGAAYHYIMVMASARLASPYDEIGMYWRLSKWHLDAFFFELVSSFDCLLQEINERYELQIPEDKVSWDILKRKEYRSKIPAKLFQLLEKEWNKDWLKKVRGYRNTATHRSYSPTSKSWVGFIPRGHPHMPEPDYVEMWSGKGEHEPIQNCKEYLKSMADLIVTAWGEFLKE